MAGEQSESAVLFANVSGSTNLYETAGDAVAHAAVEKCLHIMRQQTVRANGRVIKTIGDEVMSAFASADQAATAAIEMQNAILELPPVANTYLGIRIGFHYGPVLERDGDLFGDAVNLAARLAEVAAKGQIITALEPVTLMSGELAAATRPIATIQVKGKAQEIHVYELLWQENEDLTALGSRRSMFKPKDAKLRLIAQGNEVILSAERPSLVMGRDASANLVVKERTASRVHGKIERRRGKFVLTDHSANGTFVTVEGDKEIVLRREEFTLRKHGWIALGQSRTKATDVIEFFCD